MSRSFHDKILRVNLTDGTVEVEEPGIVYLRRYMGGWNFIADVLLNEVPPGADPLGPENKLVFAPGVLTGLAVSGASRSAVGAKSPLTGAFGAAEVGGDFAVHLKRAGFDAVIVEGASPEPVYLWIEDGEAELRDATHLWGEKTKETQETVREELGERRAELAMIGPGGENLVRYACVMHGNKDAAGRTGLGAVMGSKRLKAIAAHGSEALEGSDPDRIREMARGMAQAVAAGEKAESLHQYGTGVFLEDMVETGNLPTRNFRDGDFEAAAEISANSILDRIGIGMEGCYACAVRCKKVVEVEEPYEVDPTYGGPEYETIAALGSCCGIDDIHAISRGSQLCNSYSLDTIATGVVVAFAMECFENGLLTEEETDGLELRFGNAEVLEPVIDKIAHREGIGELLAEGCWRAAREIGQDAERFAMQVKGQEMPMHEPRFKRGLAIGYSVSPTGADHVHSLHDSGLVDAEEDGMLGSGRARSLGVLEPLELESLGPGKVRAALYHSISVIADNCLCACLFVPWTIAEKAELVRAATGWEDVSAYELYKVGERALTLARVFNAREGFGRADDHLPERSYGPTTSGALADGGIDREELREAVQDYYAMLDWDEDGVPTATALQELDVDWAIEHLPEQGA